MIGKVAGLTRTRRGVILRIGLLVLTACISLTLLALPIAIRPSTFPVNVGDVAAQDILAPYAVTFNSDILTEQARKTSEDAVQPFYTPVDTAVARRQIEKLHIVLDYISSVRFDSFASQSQKISDLSNIANLQLKPETITQILLLAEVRWQMINDESVSVLEQIMRNTIREGNVADAQRNIPTLISYSISEDQASIIYEIAAQFVIPNSLFSSDKTAAAKLEMRNAVKPVERSYAAGEIVVRRGQVITPTIFETLQVYDLVQTEGGTQSLIAVLALVTVTAVFVGLYFSRRKLQPLYDAKNLILISILFILFLTGTRIVIPNRVVVPYLFPLAAFGLTVGSLFNMELGMILSLILSVLSGYNLPNSLDLTIFYVIGSFFGILILGKGRRVIHFFWAGIAIGLAGAAVIVSYRLTDMITDWMGLATLVGAGFLNGLASASLTLLFQFLFAQLLGVTTSMQLLDLSRPDHPLLQFLLRNAPGTYQHSLQVSNLAEQAAESIGADALLVRVGCLYHDIGKTANPAFFVENQVPGKVDSHDDLEPSLSAATIIRHVTEGQVLAKKYRIPSRIQDFIREHHGTNITRYQYTRAVMAAGNNPDAVNKEVFRYPGPKPRSRETAILMLADGCEARARAELPKDDGEVREVIRKVFEFLQTEGQFDDTVLTLKDLHKVQESFFASLKNTYHPRIKYPELRSSTSNVQSPGGEQEKSETSMDSNSKKASQ